MHQWLPMAGFAGLALWAASACAQGVPSDGHERPIAFARDVVPALTKAGCNAGSCHGSLQGRGGLRLSLLGFNAAADYEALFQASRGRRVIPSAPEGSLFLLKAAGQVPHGGGSRIRPGDATWRILYDYLAQGLPPPASDDPKVIDLRVVPSTLRLEPDQSANLEVHATWSDGSIRDITAWALYDSRHETIASVSREGLIEAAKSGMSSVTVRYCGQVAAVEVLVPFARDAPTRSFAANNFIDELVAARWDQLGVAPAPLCTDHEFIRRAFIDLIGTLPTPNEVRAFAASTASDKRATLVDQLLDRPEYVDYWTARWGDLLRVHRRYLGDRGLGSFLGWIRRSVRENRPLDAMVRELLTAQGNLFTAGPVGFYFVDERPEELAETTAQVFLGVRLQCARCHHHPLEIWSQDDYYGLAAFFTRLVAKTNGDNGRFGGARIIRAVPDDVPARRLAVPAVPKLLGQPPPGVEGEADIRRLLADWVTSADNPYFARNFANRYWFYLTGRGLVEPVDDLRLTNPPSNPALLDALAGEFSSHGFDIKHLLRTICNSRVYQLASELTPDRDHDGALFTHRVPRRLPAEVLLDAINQAAGTQEQFAGQPAGTRAIALADPSIYSYFLTAFGKPARTSACECARGGMPDLSQVLHMANSTAIHAKVIEPVGRLARLVKAGLDESAIVEELYLATFSRPPTSDERAAITELLTAAPTREEGLQDLLWTLLNSAEFTFNH